MAIIASEGFENEDALSSTEQYLSPDLTDELETILGNQPGGVVNATFTGGIGYSASITGTRGDQGSDTDTLGVVTNGAGVPQAIAEGANAYAIGDPDGLFTLTFDDVDISGHTNVSLSIDYLVSDEAYESNDLLSIFVETDAGTVSIINFGEPELEGVPETWQTGTVTIPSGATFARLVVQFDSNAANESAFFDNVVVEGDPICFVAGTVVSTTNGTCNIEDLALGARVELEGGRFKPVRWIGRTRIQPKPGQFPIRIAKGSWLGNTEDLCVSPAHRILISGWRAQMLFDVSEVLVAAQDLVNDRSIVIEHETPEVEYIHILFDKHELVLASGILSESFHPNHAALDSCASDVREELLTLFPELAKECPLLARPVISKQEALEFTAF